MSRRAVWLFAALFAAIILAPLVLAVAVGE